MDTMTQRKPRRTQGMNWIRPEKRLAIYLRDGLACAYCGEGIEDGTKLTLDHIRPYASGGSNSETNLVTACLHCNSSRGKRSCRIFISAVARYINHGATTEQITAHITTTRRRRLDLAAAKELISRRGGFVAALEG